MSDNNAKTTNLRMCSTSQLTQGIREERMDMDNNNNKEEHPCRGTPNGFLHRASDVGSV